MHICKHSNNQKEITYFDFGHPVEKAFKVEYYNIIKCPFVFLMSFLIGEFDKNINFEDSKFAFC